MGQEPSEIRHEIEETRDRMGDTVDALTSKANVGQRVKSSLGEQTEKVRTQMQSTASQVNDATPGTADVREGAQRAVGVAQRNPLGLALGGVAAGFLVGMALPSTRIEDKHIGSAADELKDRAVEGGQEALEKGKQVAQDVVETAKDSAQDAVASAEDSPKETGEPPQGVSGAGETGSDRPVGVRSS
jgi:hypothetical protein